MKKLVFQTLLVVVLLSPVLTRLSPWNHSGAPTDADSGTVVAASRPAARAWGERVRGRIREARRLMERRADLTAGSSSVTLAVEDSNTSRVHLLTVPKETFLQQGAEVLLDSSEGAQLRLRVVRPNYVNTSVRVTDAAGNELSPLAVRYPVEKNGRVDEVAFYTSAHPAMRSEAIEADGRAYIRRSLDAAAARLASKGEEVSPEVVDIAERLCVVEHTDHKRFETEDRANIFNEVAALYALNAGDTYRYSVSSAGAGGMVQMIPPTYKAVREMHPRVGLKADFVEGMRDHSNALQAMLLYMQDTWDNLKREEEINLALASGLATQAELLAAGYNSNPMRLARYIERGGPEWRTLIPRETQMYLRIYAAVEELVPSDARS